MRCCTARSGHSSLCVAGEMDPTIVISHVGPLEMAPHFYKIFDGKQDEVRRTSVLHGVVTRDSQSCLDLRGARALQGRHCAICRLDLSGGKGHM